MRLRIALLAACLLLATPPSISADQSIDDVVRDNVSYWLDRADVTAHVRNDRIEVVQEIRDDRGHVGYVRFRVSATVLESFRGSTPGPIEFFVTQEQPSTPPLGGIHRQPGSRRRRHAVLRRRQRVVGRGDAAIAGRGEASRAPLMPKTTRLLFVGATSVAMLSS